MYEFIASGIQPAKPFESYMKGAEAAQNMQANSAKLESANIALEGAKKAVQAEKQWGALPRDEAGKIDPQAEQQFKSAFPDYYDTRKKAEVAQVRDQIGLAAEQFATSAALFSKAKSPEDIAAAQKFAKDNFGMDIEYDEAVFGTVQKYSTELAQKSAMIREDMATAAAAGDYETVNKLQSALASETNLAALEVQKAQASIARDRAAAASSNASAYKYYQQGNKASAEASAAATAGSPRDPVNLRNAEKSVKDIDLLLNQADQVGGAISGEGLGVGNKIQRGLAKIANVPLTIFGGEGVTAMAQEFGDAQTLRQFRKAVEIAFSNNPKMPVAEMEKIRTLFNEIDPDSLTAAKGTAVVPLLEIVTTLKNVRERDKAFLENREPKFIERPRLGTEEDPIMAPVSRDDPSIQNYLRENKAKPGMVIQWPDGSTSTLGGKK